MQKLSWNFHEFTFSIINYIFKSKIDFFFYFLFFLNFNYDSFNYLFLPACCAPHAGLGIEKFFFTICQENFMKKLLGKFHGKFIFMTSHFQK